MSAWFLDSELSTCSQLHIYQLHMLVTNGYAMCYLSCLIDQVVIAVNEDLIAIVISLFYIGLLVLIAKAVYYTLCNFRVS